METKYLGHITVNGKVYLFLKENRKINFFRVNERFFSRWLADGYSVYLSIDHDFFLVIVVNLSCISSSDPFLTQTTYTTGPSLQHWVLRFNNTNTRSLFVICCGSKNSSTLFTVPAYWQLSRRLKHKGAGFYWGDHSKLTSLPKFRLSMLFSFCVIWIDCRWSLMYS